MERRRMVRRATERAPAHGEYPLEGNSESTEKGDRRSGVDRRGTHAAGEDVTGY